VLKILTIGHSYVVGLNRRLPQEWAKLGCAVTVVAPKKYRADQGWLTAQSEPSELFRLETIPVSRARWSHIFGYGSPLRALLAQSWDVVHIWEEPFIYASWPMARWLRPQCLAIWATFQNLPKHYPPPFHGIERVVMARANGWIAFGETVQKNLEARAGYRDKPHRVIPPGVAMESFQPNVQQRIEVRQRLGWDDTQPVIGLVGRWVEEKGLRFFQNMLSSWTKPCRVLIIGGGPLEPLVRAWENTSGGRVRALTGIGHVEVPAYLNAMDVLALPSRTTPRWCEQFGRILIEAMACGVPVVGSRSGEIPYVIGDVGWVVDENDTMGWHEALAAAIGPEGNVRAAQARQRVAEKFAVSQVAKRHLDFFAELGS
jgi:glycosyltransferase involved in cell wall biosynthesis